MNSAQTLFHFTSSETYLVSILQNGFFPRYCLENVSYLMPDENKAIEMALPMTCFCDIRLTETKTHAYTYGKFVIGLTKEWGIRNSVTPVLYYHAKSKTQVLLIEKLHHLRNFIDAIEGLDHEEIKYQHLPNVIVDNLEEIFESLYASTDYFKPISGKMKRGNAYFDISFYDEREWRYVPYFNVGGECKAGLSIEEYNKKEIKECEEAKLVEVYKLMFQEEDIKYIIIPSSQNILEFQLTLKNYVTRLNVEKLLHKIKAYDDITLDY